MLQKIAMCPETRDAIADYMLDATAKKDVVQELRGLLAEHVAHITPSTIWYLDQPMFKSSKAQQLVRLKISFCVSNRFEGEPAHMINLAANLKSPAGLADVFLTAMIRTKTTLSYRELMDRYKEALSHIKGDTELNQVIGQHLS
jgi:hypothetical protein